MADRPWNGCKVLIIDDSRTVREALKAAYSSIGLQVVGLAENGLNGLIMIRELRPDIVNLDIIMPEMDGVECYRKISAIDSTIKCVMNSWLSGEAKVVSGLKDLIPHYLFQPKTTQASILEARLDILYNPHKADLRMQGGGDRDFGDEISDLGIKVS